MTVPGVEVRTSPISGRGVFARRPFRKGQVVIAWDITHRVLREQIDSLSAEQREWLAPYDEKWLILMQPPACYVNHSCTANTAPCNFCDVATRDIALGEEITSDYRLLGTKPAFECHCGAANCMSR